MKSFKLVLDYDYDFEVLAVISSVKSYKLAWAINKSLNINLCKTEDICLEFVRQDRLLVSNFIFETEYATFRLLKNKTNDQGKGNKNYLVPELKDYDYLIKLSGEGTSLSADSVLLRLKELSV